ncbi:DinB superfamily protein [Mucilaginibacter mallensis]|uniref:DinB superfamily protein n=1 Tax=Mucilaginibacter mallensis TaxID=652787 RepID=A0A1H1TF46_MUCMA|nr:DinB family protein [Mucilaginibacter mallensis]SDS58945.1 DinB superfamily protein [Mucilaginibacter mallensis]
MIRIGRPNSDDAPAWYGYFFDLAPGDDLLEALENSKQYTLELISTIPAEKEDFAYAEGKWTIKQAFIHLADEERYYAYKAFCYSRQTNVHLEIPMGENYAKDFNVSKRSFTNITDDYLAVRNATITLFKGMSNEMLDFKNFPVTPTYTARSLGWFTVGHNLHHCKLIKEKYLGQ